MGLFAAKSYIAHRDVDQPSTKFLTMLCNSAGKHAGSAPRAFLLQYIEGSFARDRPMFAKIHAPSLVALVLLAGCSKNDSSSRADSAATSQSAAPAAACTGDNAGLKLPPGFCATIFADSIGHARHLAVGPDGTVYVNTWSGDYYQGSIHPGGFLVALRDTNNDGRADTVARFGRAAPAKAGTQQGSSSATGSAAEKSGAGGTGIGLYNGYLYAEEGATIVRYKLRPDSMTPEAKEEVVVSGLPLNGDHPMHPFAIDKTGSIYIDMGSATNSCQIKNRTLESPGHKPCTELEQRGGIWRYDANKLNQRYSSAGRYATGIRNADGIAVAGDGSVYSTQHGRDQLAENWPKLYTAEQGQNLPAEELLKIQEGGDYGWPMCYFDNEQAKLVLAPEYGGDGKQVGDCASKIAPVAFFPAHWAPNDLLFYTGTMFPERYRGGALIAFHGSWNRAPGPQGGYLVAFVPFNGGAPASANKFETFADGFAGANRSPDAAAHRPAGLALGPDGAIYVADDKGGTVFRIVYTGKNQ
jgi:glucose/arabinose dehydrogenase